MKVLVFGATGALGRAVVARALTAGHAVTAFVRDPARSDPAPGLDRVVGDATCGEDVARAVPGHDVIIVSLGERPKPLDWLPGLRRTPPSTVCETGTRHILAALPAEARIIVVSAYGVGDTRAVAPWYYRLYLRIFLSDLMADKERQEALLKASGLDYTIVQPVALTDSAAAGAWVASAEGAIGKQQVSRADLANFIITEATEGQHHRQTVAFSG